MNRSIVLGLAGGGLVGATAAVVLERSTHAGPGSSPAGLDDWTRDFNEHFAEQQAAGTERNERLTGELETWTREHPAPDGMSAARSNESWSVDNTPSGGRGSTAWVTAGGVIAGMIASFPIMALEKSGTDMRSFVGLKGALALAPIAACTAWVAGFIASDLSH